jgi:uncharacterized protein (DUF305 family)
MHTGNQNMHAKVGAIVFAALIIGVIIGHLLPRNSSPMPQSHFMPNGTAISDTMSDMTASLQGKTGDDFDRAFISEMITHHEGAVDMAELALQNAGHSEIKQLAQNIISAQTAEIANMRGWQASWFDIR